VAQYQSGRPQLVPRSRRRAGHHSEARGEFARNRRPPSWRSGTRRSWRRIAIRRGLSSYLEILIADQQLFLLELQLAPTRGNQLRAFAQLYRALGGGWQPEPPPPPRHPPGTDAAATTTTGLAIGSRGQRGHPGGRQGADSCAGVAADYERRWLQPDIIAGVTAASVIIPKAMAYATLAGLAVQTGLYTALLPMLVYAFLGDLAPAERQHHDDLGILTAC
jgi:hypothetical protein